MPNQTMTTKTVEITPANDAELLENARMTVFTPAQIAFMWSKIQPLLSTSADVSPDISVEELHAGLLNGMFQAVVITRNNEQGATDICGVLVYKIVKQKQNKVMFMVATAGEYITRINYFDALKEIMKSREINKLQCWARPSAARLWNRLGIKTLYSVMEIDV